MSPHWSPANADLPTSGVTPGTYGDATHSSQVTVAASGLVTAASNVLITGGGGGGGPTEVAYVEFTAPLNVTATTEGTAQTVVSAGAVSFDGATKVQIQFFAPSIEAGANKNLFFDLFDGATALGWLGVIGNAGAATSNFSVGVITRELTPSNASHTYIVKAYTASGGNTQWVDAGTGGAGTYLPGFIRIVTVI